MNNSSIQTFIFRLITQGFINWTWTVCNLSLKKQTKSKFPVWPLRQSIALTHPSKKDVEPIVRLRIEVEKAFLYMQNLGWGWHKSWNIPTITIQLDILDPITKEELYCPNGLKAQMHAVRSSIDANNKVTLVEVGLQGQDKLDIVEGKTSFQSLKFASTSFINDNAKFYLVICIYLQVAEDTRPKILKSVISPSVFVDSRKRVKENEKSAVDDSSALVLIEPFYPDNFGKKFIKKSAKKKDAPAKEIQNTLEGMYLYLTAPNIRHKIRHPIFLSVEFSACTSLFYNSFKIKDKEKENFVEVLQNLFYKDLAHRDLSEKLLTEESSFLIYVNIDEIANDQYKVRRLTDLLTPMICRSFSIVYSEEEIPKNFLQFSDVKHIRELYSKTYLILDANKDLIYDEDSDQDGFSDKMPKPPGQTISCLSYERDEPMEGFWRDYFFMSEVEEIIIKKIKEEQDYHKPINMLEKKEAVEDSLSLNIAHNHSTNESAGNLLIDRPNTSVPNFNGDNPCYLNQIQNQAPVQTNVHINPEISQNFVNNNSGLLNFSNSLPVGVTVFNNYSMPSNQVIPVVYAGGVAYVSQNPQMVQSANGFQQPTQLFIQQAPRPIIQQQQQQVILATDQNGMPISYTIGVMGQSRPTQFQ